jgi:hypothetical protein
MVGCYLVYATATLNLNTTAKMSYRWFFYEPILFYAIVWLDSRRMVAADHLLLLYAFFVAQTCLKYLVLMVSVFRQVTSHLGISFLTIQPKEPPKVLNLKDSIDEFYETKQPLFRRYEANLRTLFEKLATQSSSGVKYISFDDYANFMQGKHIRVTKEKIVSICLTDAVTDKISYISFVKLMLLVSCTSDKT